MVLNSLKSDRLKGFALLLKLSLIHLIHQEPCKGGLFFIDLIPKVSSNLNTGVSTSDFLKSNGNQSNV